MVVPSLARAVPPALVLLVVAAGAGACGGGGGAGEVTGRFGGLHTAVCRAADEADDGDLEGAQGTFDDVHVGLHDLAATAEREDRSVAGRLLEAKQQVEAELSATNLRELVEPVADAIEVTGGTAPDSCS